ncbi:ERAP1-like C-terminal domain-containing protein [Russula emetica]|nr:ERAP1-like C-terminal domain-containing protein [Russula emetica]
MLDLIHYDLTIRTDLEKENFSGFVRIDLDIVNATKVVTFNAAAELNSAQWPSSSPPRVSSLSQLRQNLPAGSKATLRVGFESAMTDSMTGYYKKKLGLEYSKTDSADITQLRTLAVEGAATVGDTATVKALLKRFSDYIAGDTSSIPADLLKVTFCTSVTTGANEPCVLGRRAHRCPGIRCGAKLFENPPTNSIKVAAIRGLTNAVDPPLQEHTFKLIQTGVRNQDLVYFFRDFSMNPKAINALREFFETNYNSIYTRLETTFTMRLIVQFPYTEFSNEEDRAKAEAFFKLRIHSALTKISASTIKPWRRHWMASALKLRLSRYNASVLKANSASYNTDRVGLM